MNPRDFDDPPECVATAANAGSSLPASCTPGATRPPGTTASTAPRGSGATSTTTTTRTTGTSRPNRTAVSTTSPDVIDLSTTTVPRTKDRPDLTAELARNQALWASRHPAGYRYTWSNGCFCPQSVTGPFVVTVDGATVTVTVAKPGNLDPSASIDTSIEAAFAKAEKAIGQADQVTISYDPTFGFPTSMSIDWVKNAVDDEESVSITGFAPH